MNSAGLSHLKCLLLFIPLLCFSCCSPKSHTSTPIRKYLKPIQITEQKPGIQDIDCIYVINLDARKEKWARVSALFDEKRLKVNRVSGVNGYVISEDEKRELSGPYSVQLRGTQIGCLLSHLSIIHDAYKRGYSTIWVMEDDVEFVDDPQQIPKLLKTLSKLDPQWDIFYTDIDWRTSDGGYLPSFSYSPRPDELVDMDEYRKNETFISDDIKRIHRRWGTHSMFISRSGLKKIVKYYDTHYLWGAIDGDLHYIPGIREYASRHDIVTNSTKNVISDTNNSSIKTCSAITP